MNEAMRELARRLMCTFLGLGCPPVANEELERALERAAMARRAALLADSEGQAAIRRAEQRRRRRDG